MRRNALLFCIEIMILSGLLVLPVRASESREDNVIDRGQVITQMLTEQLTSQLDGMTETDNLVIQEIQPLAPTEIEEPQRNANVMTKE